MWRAFVSSPPESILCRTIFCCNYNCKSFWGCLYQLCTSREWHFCPFFFVKFLKLCQIGELLGTAIFKSCHRFSIGFRSGFWLGHSNTWIYFELNHSIVALAVCLGLLSCWKVNLRPSLKSFADSNMFSSKIALYLALSIFPSTLTSFPVPAEEKHPHNMMLPPCFTAGMVCSGRCAVLVFCHT